MPNEPAIKIVEEPGGGSAKPKPKSKPKAKAHREKPAHVLPTNRITLTKQLDILRAYAAASGVGGKPVSVEEVAKIADVAVSSFSLVNPFLSDIGLLQRVEQKGEAWKFVPSQDVMNFAKAYEWNRDTAAHKLAPTFSSSWFGEVLSQRLVFKELSESDAVAALAEKASVGPEYQAQLRMLVDFMGAAGLAQKDNGIIRNVRQSGVPNNGDRDAEGPKEQAQPQIKTNNISTAFMQPTQGVVNFHVDVKINMDEFATWPADRIASFFAGIAQVLAAKGAIEKEASK